jgi:hypothetical protein
MSLSAREQRILSEIERDLTATEPLLGRALASMRLGRRDRVVSGERARRPRGGPRGWVIVMITGLVAGIAVSSAGFLFRVLAMVLVGTALAQLSLVAGWLARALSTRPRAGR